MSAGNWTNSDSLFLQFGTAKATVEQAGEFQMPGSPNRCVEVFIDLSLLPAFGTAGVLSTTEFFPAGQNIYIEAVEVIALATMSTASSPTISVGLIQGDVVRGGSPPYYSVTSGTVPTNGATAFVNAAAASTLAVGDRLYLTVGVTAVGSFVGNYLTQWNTNTPTGGGANTTGGYLTATLGTANATGKLRVRIFYHGEGTIPY